MVGKLDFSIVIPCFNEKEGIGHLVSRLKEFEEKLKVSHEFIFVDDGSSDNTYNMLKDAYKERLKKDVKVLKHDVNRGPGAAVRTGIANSEGEYIATMDSDCTYQPTYLLEMLDIIKRENADMITASPYHPEGQTENVPAYRLFLSKGLSNLYNLVSKAKFFTYTSMFRIYKAKAVKEVQFKSEGFLAMAEILINSHKGGQKIIEYPAMLTGRKFGTSNAKTLVLIKQHICFIMRILLGYVKKEEK